PPMESIVWAMSSADRVAVPLNSMCSTKWAMPLSSVDSCREPRASHTPTLTERTCGIRSVSTRNPPGRTVRPIGVGVCNLLKDQELGEQTNDNTQGADPAIEKAGGFGAIVVRW